MPGTLVFSHANGFPAGTYRTLFEVWRAAGHEVHAIERLGGFQVADVERQVSGHRGLRRKQRREGPRLAGSLSAAHLPRP